MENKTKKKLIIVSVCVALVLVIAVSSVLYLVFCRKSSSENNEVVTPVNQTYSSAYEYTNCSNESILRRVISTSNYNGEWTLSSIISIDYNDDLSEENIYQLYANYGVRDASSFRQYIFNIRKGFAETLSITRYVDENGSSLNYATLTASSNEYGICSGDIYGDDDLALVDLNGESDSNFFISNTGSTFYISMNYTPTESNNTTVVSENTSDTIYLYLFEDVYSSNNTSLRLFTVTYAFTLKVNSSNISNDDMVI